MPAAATERDTGNIATAPTGTLAGGRPGEQICAFEEGIVVGAAPEVENFLYATAHWDPRIVPGREPFPELTLPWGGAAAGMAADVESKAGNELATLRSENGPGREGKTEGGAKSGRDGAEDFAEMSSPDREEWLRRIAEQCRAAEERGRGQGVEIGAARGREETARQVKIERDRLQAQAAALAAGFSSESSHYRHQLEQEAVRLALAIAARVLRREVETDPLLLTGAVRVALGQLAESTTVRIRVPARDHAMWAETLALVPNLPMRPLVIADEGMDSGECRVETELGSADLSWKAQLSEIEQGFFGRPATGSAAGKRRDPVGARERL